MVESFFYEPIYNELRNNRKLKKGWWGNMEKYKNLSKFISKILRHKPEVIGVELNQYGWCNVNELIDGIKKNGKYIDFDILNQIVEEDLKQRYSFSSDARMIRANQGHSVPVNLELNEVEPPDILYHGTVERFVNLIFEKGLIKGHRQYVHLSNDIETARNVASRRGDPVLLNIKAKLMHKDGFTFYRSDNGVWLCDFVPA